MDRFFQSLSLSIRFVLARKTDIVAPSALQLQVKKLENKYQQVAELERTTIEFIYTTAKRAYAQGSIRLFPDKQIKHLPWVLYHGNRNKRIIDDVGFTRFIVDIFSKKPLSVLNSLIYVYLMHYDKEAPGTEIIRGFLEERIIGYEGRSPRIRRWKERAFLFTKHGITMALSKVRVHGALNENLAQMGFSGSLRAGQYVEEIVKNYYVAQIPITEKIAAIRPLFNMEAQPGHIYFPNLVPHVANNVLPAIGVNASREIQDIVRSFLLNNLGDPRIHGNRTRWAEVSEQAKTIFRQWVSRLDLEMFFSVVEKVAKDKVWRYRRKFWEAYLPYAENTWVALGANASTILKQSALSDVAEGRKYGMLSGAASDQSVFMIEMRGLIFVEWSHSGKLRIWEKGNYPLEFGRDFYTGREIRSGCDWELIHYSSETYGWQDVLAGFLKEQCNLTPVQSYRLR